MPGKTVKSADRTLDVLEFLAASAADPSFAQIASALSIPRSSLFHLLGNLSQRGYVRQVTKGRYTIGPRLAELVAHGARGVSLAALLDPLLRELSQTLNETCGLNVQRGDEVEVVASHTGRHALTYTMKVADCAPLYAVSGGKILLAYMDPAWLRSYLDRVRFERFTPGTIQSADRLLQEIEQARREGFAYSHEEFTPGIVGIGVAIVSGGEAVASFNVAVPTARFGDSFAALLRQRLRAAARQAETLLGRHRGFLNGL